MNLKPESRSCGLKLAALVMASVLMASCSGGSSTAQLGSTSTATSSAGSVPGTLITPPAATGINSVPIVIDAGPVSGSSEINVAFVQVTVCTPGTTITAACQTIDHVALDTGSSGLRLLKSELYSNLNLPAVTNGGGAIGECLPFVIGATWGSVRYADIYLGGEVARNVPIQDIGDNPDGAAAIPKDCVNAGGTIQDTQALLGSNGILGVGPFQNDCDACLTQAIPAAYYSCTSNGCTNSIVTAAQVVQNPVAIFPQDNNGVLIELPPVSSAGAKISLPGYLIFGIGTQQNNQLGSATVYATDVYGNFSTTYKGTLMTSYIDSGSNALFFNDLTIPFCSTNTWAYCPTSSPLPLSATNSAASGGTTGAMSFSIVNADQLFTNPSVVAGNIGGWSGGTSSTQVFAWGLPFFFGRPVFTAISGASTPAGSGPYFAY